MRRRSPRLRGRLLGSYILLLLVMLAVVTVAFLLFLFAQPVPATDTYQRLITVMRDVVQESGLATRPTLGELRNLVRDLPQIAQNNEVRILIMNIPIRTVQFDSSGTFQRGDSVSLNPETYTLSTFLRNRLGISGETVFGRLHDPGGEQWLYAGVAGVRQGNETNAIVLADQSPTQTTQAVLDRFQRELALPLCQSALVGLVVAVLLAAAISRTLARPLVRLEQAAEDVAQGNYDQRVPEDGPAEFKALAAAFNRMSGEVQATQQAQKDFVANVSHDLKTPLTSIQGFSQAIMDGAAKDPSGAAKIIYEEAGRLNRMVTQLTDLERLQSGRFSMRSVLVDISQLAAAVGERLAIVARDRGLTLHISTPPMPEVTGDGDRLAQVLTNLVSNAIKYTPSGGEVWLHTQVNNGGVEIVVRDTGQGIAPEELPRIFERFYQVDKTRGPRRGTGLGLAITQEIVLAHGGQIGVSSAGVGKGTTFTVWLPSPKVASVVSGRG
ncbi:MAG: HAMP domain-containing sensor histidine kinase [Anaerolineae bacterium]